MSSKLTNCSVCGAQIATNAKQCPQCGAKVKKPLLKKLLSFFVAIIAFCVVISLFSDDSVNNEMPNSPSIQENEYNQVSDSQSEKEVENDYNTSSQSDVMLQNEKIDYLQSLGQMMDSDFVITENAINFLKQYYDLFPVAAGSENTTTEFIDSSITYEHLNKNISKYGNNLINIEGYVLDIEEAPDSSATYVHIIDYEENNYVLFYFGVLDNIFAKNNVSACVLPLSLVTFENRSAAYTEAIVCAACFVNLV